ncbi:MAG: hypothetical protein ABIN36_01765 [Ferruginibacter sp.]
MKSLSIKLLLTLITIGCTKVYAGWYECYNFNGNINRYPISLSIQVREGYFGGTKKKNFNIIGVYKYNNHNNLIRLEGIIDFNNRQALLYETTNDKQTAILQFEFSENNCNGSWTDINTNKTLPLHLEYISKLVDTLDTNEYSNIEILQEASLKNFYFTGVYSKLPDELNAQMNKLKIIRKKDNVVFQTIDFSKMDVKVGSFRTVIYNNVEIYDTAKEALMVWAYLGRLGGQYIISLDKKTNKFKLNHKPLLEGGDPPDTN